MTTSITYKKAGVDIDKGNRFVDLLKPYASKTLRKEAVGSIGGFSGLFAIPSGYKEPLLIGTTDGVGTKLKIANLLKKHDTIGIDLVAMCVNDLITCGGEPLFFLDYYAMGKLDLKTSVAIIRGITEGCRQSNCTLLGGETAEMPGMYHAKDYDLAGFAVGVVDKKKMVDGSKVASGDLIVGLHSSGLHSNGYSLARKVFTEKELRSSWGKRLLIPTKIYVRPVLAVAKLGVLKAAAHITGGGFYDNIPRVLPKNKSVTVQKGSWKIPDLFHEIKRRANISEHEMFRTFNMGIGMVLVIAPKDLKKTAAVLKKFKTDFSVIGRIESGKKKKEEVVIE